MKQITVTASRSYEVKIGKGLLDALGEEVKALHPNKVCIITDETVAPLYLGRAYRSLTAAGFSVCTASVPAGEDSKSLKYYGQLLELLAEKQLTRSDLLVALGGGVVGDLTGFVAASYLRGLPFVQIPTTLLAMVDSSVGGKTAINLRAGKNLAGAFHQPSLVLCDLDLLNSLPTETFRAGCGEVIKTAILFDKELFAHLQERGMDFEREFVISRCIEHKAAVVCADEFDRGQRHGHSPFRPRRKPRQGCHRVPAEAIRSAHGNGIFRSRAGPCRTQRQKTAGRHHHSRVAPCHRRLPFASHSRRGACHLDKGRSLICSYLIAP